jgi:hypothetical protein
VAQKNEIRLELLLGKRVLAADGTVVGRLEEFRAEREGETWVVTAFDIGPAAFIRRFAVNHLGIPLAGAHGYRARWDQLDLSDPDRPLLRCDVAELSRLR